MSRVFFFFFVFVYLFVSLFCVCLWRETVKYKRSWSSLIRELRLIMTKQNTKYKIVNLNQFIYVRELERGRFFAQYFDQKRLLRRL